MCLPQALRYAAWGWRVLPLRPGSKIPLIKDWPNSATTDPGTITEWWTRTPAANLGIATGGGLIGLDVDDKNGHHGSATLAALERQHGDLPPTWTVGTPSAGVHHYLSYVGSLGNSVGKLGDGLDIRADGGFVAAPPSVVNGRPYIVLIDAPVAPAPPWLIEMLTAHHQAGGRGQGHTAAGLLAQEYARPSKPGSPVARLRGLVQTVLDAPEGCRNDRLNWAAYQAADIEGVPREQVQEALRLAGVEVGLSDAEALATIASGLTGGGR
ncbi:bifunctional DNA primase/polymerase [Streptomyces europaeiscabiei]|uniref:bifunctional DNA primase/polymerase n=1 Tax=Streptomyces europaeiscabiei TaxID=146819 RepID=UPI0030E0C0DA